MWVWHQDIEPVIVFLGVAFKESSDDTEVHLKINGEDRGKLEISGPTIVHGIHQKGHFVRDHPPQDTYYYYAVEPVRVFGLNDMAMTSYFQGGEHAKGYPEYEIRRVVMG